jgi:hypothetical protein
MTSVTLSFVDERQFLTVIQPVLPLHECADHAPTKFDTEPLHSCSHRNLMAHVEQRKALSRKAKPIAFLSKATKMSETTK